MTDTAKTTTKKPAAKKPVTAKVPKPKAAKPKTGKKLEGLSRARAMARKRGYHVRTDRHNPGQFSLITDTVLAEGSVAALIEFMKGGDEEPAAPEPVSGEYNDSPAIG
jgi:hypothetical protein